MVGCRDEGIPLLTLEPFGRRQPIDQIGAQVVAAEEPQVVGQLNAAHVVSLFI
jgi:hypothetical protein